MADRDPKGPSVGAHGKGEAVEVPGEWSPDGRRRYARLSWTAGLLLVLISGTVLLGWTVDFELFKHVLPGRSPMQPMTAVGLLLAGTALMLRGERTPWRLVSGGICAAVVASLGALFLVGYLFEVDVVVDQLLFPRTLAAYADDYPGRSSEIASLGMLVAGLGLLLQGGSGRGSQLLGRVAGGAVLVVSLPVLIGNLYGVTAFYAFAGLTPTAPNTTIGLILLGLGLLLYSPGHSPVSVLLADDLGGRLVRRLIPVAILLPLALGWLRLLAEDAGLVDTQVGTAGLVLVLILLLVAILWSTGGTVHRVDADRQRSLRVEMQARRGEQAARHEIEALLEAASTGVYGLDPEGRCTFINLAGATMLGYEREELLGRNMHDLAHHTDSEGRPYHPQDCPINRAISADVVVRVDGEVLWRRDGTSFPVEYSSSPIHEEGGVVGAVVTFIDITARVRMQEAMSFLSVAGVELAATLDLDEALRRVARLAVPRLGDECAIHIIDPLTNRVQRAEIASPYPEKESPVRRLIDRLHLDHGSAHPVAEVLRSGEAQLIPELTSRLAVLAEDADHLRALRELDPASAVIAPLRLGGRISGAITLITGGESGRIFDEEDLELVQQLADRAALALENARLYSEAARRAREEAALREAVAEVTDALTIQDATRAIAETALGASGSDGAFVERIDNELQETEVVATAGSVVPPLGSRGALRGSYAEEVIRRAEARIVDRLLEGGRLLPGDLVEQHGDCTAAILPLVHAGMAFGVLVLIRTPERQPFHPDELERARTFVDLAALAFRKVYLLHESERGRNELQRLMAGRERLMRGFTHDLKNPLGAADVRLQVLEMAGPRELDEEQAKGVTRARGSIARAVQLLDELSDFARADAEQIELECLPVDVRELARETTEEHRAMAEAKGLRLEMELQREQSVIDSDSSRIRQTLGNLISNAIKYTDSGHIEVRVVARDGRPPGTRLSSPGGWVVVHVFDTGPGIPEDKREEVFQEFVRLSPATAPGAGIGLAISRRLAQVLGGEVTLESKVGEGSTFTLWLPRRGCVRTSPSRPHPPQPAL